MAAVLTGRNFRRLAHSLAARSNAAAKPSSSLPTIPRVKYKSAIDEPANN
jgi:hypothetical protein